MTNRPIDAIHALINHTDACSTDPYRADDNHDTASRILRDLLCTDLDDRLPHISDFIADYEIPDYEFDTLTAIHAAATAIRADKYSRDDLSALALDLSLCPMHFTDYAICFDDDDDECAAIRAAFPNHDT